MDRLCIWIHFLNSPLSGSVLRQITKFKVLPSSRAISYDSANSCSSNSSRGGLGSFLFLVGFGTANMKNHPSRTFVPITYERTSCFQHKKKDTASVTPTVSNNRLFNSKSCSVIGTCTVYSFFDTSKCSSKCSSIKTLACHADPQLIFNEILRGINFVWELFSHERLPF